MKLETDEFKEESWEAVHARFDAALEPLNHYATMQRQVEKYTGDKLDEIPLSCLRRHVFDLPNGLRMIVTRDQTPLGIFKHLSFGRGPELPRMSGEELIHLARATARRFVKGETCFEQQGLFAYNLFFE